jgi:GAF domain-containing protein
MRADGGVLKCDDSEIDPRVDREACRLIGVRSMIVVPLQHENDTVGVLKVLSSKANAFTEQDVQTLQLIAGLVATSMARAASFEAQQRLLEEREARNEVETINRIGRMLSAELDLQKLVQAVTDAATQLTGAKYGAFFYSQANDRGEKYMLYTLSGAPREAFEKFPMVRITEIFGPTFRDGKNVAQSEHFKR